MPEDLVTVKMRGLNSGGSAAVPPTVYLLSGSAAKEPALFNIRCSKDSLGITNLAYWPEPSSTIVPRTPPLDKNATCMHGINGEQQIQYSMGRNGNRSVRSARSA